MYSGLTLYKTMATIYFKFKMLLFTLTRIKHLIHPVL